MTTEQTYQNAKRAGTKTKIIALLPLIISFALHTAHSKTSVQIIFSAHVQERIIVLGSRSITDARAKDQTPQQIYSNAIMEGMKGSGLESWSKWFTKMIKRSGKNLRKSPYMAYSKWAHNWRYDYVYKDENLLIISVDYVEARVILIPKKVSTKLRNHEDGHLVVRRLAVIQLKTDVENIGARATNIPLKQVIRMIRVTIKETNVIAKIASKQFDIATNHSKLGGENQQSIAKTVWEETLKEAR